MPIIVGTELPNVPVIPEAGVFRVSWIAPSGRETSFYSLADTPSGFVTTPGVTGFDMPVYTAYEDASPGFDGVLARGGRFEARDITVPILAYSGDRSTFRVLRAALFSDLNPRSGTLGTLVVTEPDGVSSRSIPARYASGLEGALDDASQGQEFMQALIAFRAPDPLWLGDIVAPRPLGPPGGLTWLPFLPIQVAGSLVLGDTTVTNSGDSEAFPLFSITGPATAIDLRNQTTGAELVINQVITSDDVITIDTRPGRKSVLLNGTTNLYPMMPNSSDLWTLAEGDNEVTFTLPGQAPETRLSFSYQERFLAAW